MNLRETIGEYAVRYAQCQEVIGWEGEGAERIRRQFGESVDRLCRVVKVAEAAIAMAEHQAFAAYDPVVGSELLRAFVEAHKAVKDANQS